MVVEMSILGHNDLENILLDVKRLKLQGLTARKIASELDRLGYKKPCRTVRWQTHHVLNLIAELRKRGEIPPRGQFKAKYQLAEQKISYLYPKY
jgi:repressor of nif and glnA expression